MLSIEELAKQVKEIEKRNQRVEADKAWETSRIRKLVILLLTYIVVLIFFIVAELPRPFTNALIPTLAFALSTSTLPFVKRWWLKRYRTDL